MMTILPYFCSYCISLKNFVNYLGTSVQKVRPTYSNCLNVYILKLIFFGSWRNKTGKNYTIILELLTIKTVCPTFLTWFKVCSQNNWKNSKHRVLDFWSTQFLVLNSKVVQKFSYKVSFIST